MQQNQIGFVKVFGKNFFPHSRQKDCLYGETVL